MTGMTAGGMSYAGPWALDPGILALVAQAGPEAASLLKAMFEPVAAARKMPGAAGKSIAVLQVSGVMMKQPSWMGGTSTLQLRQEIQAAAADPEVGAILLSIDSPGGSIAGMADLAAETKAAGKEKPVWSQVSDMGASAAYWLASQTQRIIANSALTMVGSIGVYSGPYIDYSGMLAAAGIEVFFPTTGDRKGAFVPGPPITAEHKAYANELTAGMFEQFKGAVGKGRGMSAKQVSAVAHGGVMHAPQALDAKLIDAIQPATKTLSDLAATLKVSGPRAIFDTGRSRAVATLPMTRRMLPTLGR